MSNKKYWSSLDELNETPAYKEQAANEFHINSDENDVTEFGSNRRDFLKAMGFSVSIAALSSACQIPVKKAIPYTIDLRKAVPEIVPGVAEYFASTYCITIFMIIAVARITRAGNIQYMRIIMVRPFFPAIRIQWQISTL